MFGLKADWSLDVPDQYFTLDDYCSGEPRWCAGCGDHGILSGVQRVCREAQVKPEKTVVVSGIGCSSRFPHYMGTYGFHGLHGRALPVACGVKSRRPDLDVWVATGDGDCFSIGGCHWIHALRYNMDITVLVLDNGIYGLTKKADVADDSAGLYDQHPSYRRAVTTHESIDDYTRCDQCFIRGPDRGLECASGERGIKSGA